LWTNGELAERMEVTERTVRRDIAKLRDLGYGIQSEPGPWGGYRPSPGAKVPPLSLDDQEAFAAAVALREAAPRRPRQRSSRALGIAEVAAIAALAHRGPARRTR
jgi:predicted DNA-binding transcriptional regulator YafY